MRYKQCEWCLKNIGTINICANIGMAVLKLLGGIVASSKALLADAVHSLADVLVAVVLFVSLKVSARPPDRNYPYGRGTVEYIAMGIISVFVIGVAISIFIYSLKAIFAAELTRPGAIGILFAIVSIMGNDVISRHSFCLAKEANSPAALANAMENRADVYTSIASLIGVAGARLGFRIMDPLAAFFVGIVIAKIAISMFYKAVNGLMGESMDKAELDAINTIADSVTGVRDIFDIKSSKSGQKSLVDIEIAVEPDTKLKDVTRICELIKTRVLREVNNVGEVSVYLK